MANPYPTLADLIAMQSEMGDPFVAEDTGYDAAEIGHLIGQSGMPQSPPQQQGMAQQILSNRFAPTMEDASRAALTNFQTMAYGKPASRSAQDYADSRLVAAHKQMEAVRRLQSDFARQQLQQQNYGLNQARLEETVRHNREVEKRLANRGSSSNRIPMGYRATPSGDMEFIPGGPADPNRNNKKYMVPFGADEKIREQVYAHLGLADDDTLDAALEQELVDTISDEYTRTGNASLATRNALARVLPGGRDDLEEADKEWNMPWNSEPLIRKPVPKPSANAKGGTATVPGTPQGERFDQMPDATQFKGYSLLDEETGQMMVSDGKTWKPARQ